MSDADSKIRVFLLDDHQVVREGLRSLLEADGGMEVVGEASTAAEAIAGIPATGPKVAVLDVRLPDGSGVEVCREVRSANPDVVCLMLTSFADDEALLDAIMAGAAGYVLKEVGGMDLVGDIRKVAAGHSLIDPVLAGRVMERVHARQDEHQAAHLTAQEEKILSHIAEGLTNRQIADLMYLSEKTVKNYVSNLLAKLGMSRRTEAAVYAVRRDDTRRTDHELSRHSSTLGPTALTPTATAAPSGRNREDRKALAVTGPAHDTSDVTPRPDPLWCACDTVLADGGTAHIRPIGADDGPALVAFHAGLSDETVYLRYFSPHRQLSAAEVERFTHVDHEDRMAFVATLRDKVMAVARYDRLEPGGKAAEVAFVVDDQRRGQGLGTLLLEHLAAFARTRGITTFVAETLPHNRRMLDVFRHAGFAETSRFERGTVRVTLDIAATRAATDAVEARWGQAAARSVERLLRPRSVAVIGASRTPGTIGHEIFANLIAGGFAGPVYPVHPTAAYIASMAAYPTVAAVPGEVDLAVIAVPAAHVLEVIEQSAAKGVRDAVVISAGFAETGPDGATAERQIATAAHGAGMRLVGPNCMGVINTAAGVSMNATFAPTPPRPGRVAFSSQSGGLGIAMLEEAAGRGIGLSSFVSVGNEADVSSNDLLRYWQQDDDTDVILLYLESLADSRHFARIARDVSRTKPIVAVKAGRTPAGRRAASSHTAALANTDDAVDALFAQTGVIRVDTLQELFDVAQVLANQPLPAGRRVAIVTNTGGPAILAADACEASGLVVPELAAATQTSLRAFLPTAASVANPVDMAASASPDDYRRTVTTVLSDGSVDAVLTIFAPTLVTAPSDVATALAAAAGLASKPVVANFLASGAESCHLNLGSTNVPSFPFPESAVRALAHSCHYALWRNRPPGAMPTFVDLKTAAVKTAVQAFLAQTPGGGWLDPIGASCLLRYYGIPTEALTRADDPDQAVAAAEQIGYPVALKAAAADLVHKSDGGAVRPGLSSPAELRDAYQRMAKDLGDHMGGGIVQAMAPAGIETIVGVVHDPSFAPLIVFGSGGTNVELLADRTLRVLPLTDVDASDMIRALRMSPLLFGYRGSRPVDVAALEDLLLRVARLAQDIPEIAEMDLKPVIVTPTGVMVVDIKLRVAPPPKTLRPYEGSDRPPPGVG